MSGVKAREIDHHHRECQRRCHVGAHAPSGIAGTVSRFITARHTSALLIAPANWSCLLMLQLKAENILRARRARTWGYTGDLPQACAMWPCKKYGSTIEDILDEPVREDILGICLRHAPCSRAKKMDRRLRTHRPCVCANIMDKCMKDLPHAHVSYMPDSGNATRHVTTATHYYRINDHCSFAIPSGA
jgi:hypothetical protein